ncbi:hypothetical protein Sjap_024429 [Stephania japonica]|uniref:Uncharacterized protein n=1 Tax=Stephania japonica TaxID=461633 RepID=A0AAP0EGL4_9MAGN
MTTWLLKHNGAWAVATAQVDVMGNFPWRRGNKRHERIVRRYLKRGLRCVCTVIRLLGIDVYTLLEIVETLLFAPPKCASKVHKTLFTVTIFGFVWEEREKEACYIQTHFGDTHTYGWQNILGSVYPHLFKSTLNKCLKWMKISKCSTVKWNIKWFDGVSSMKAQVCRATTLSNRNESFLLGSSRSWDIKTQETPRLTALDAVIDTVGLYALRRPSLHQELTQHYNFRFSIYCGGERERGALGVSKTSLNLSSMGEIAPSDHSPAERKRVRSDSETDSLTAKRIRYDLLEILDDNDTSTTAALDLDSVMRSFESEITGAPPPPPPVDTSPSVMDLASDSSESQPDLGYLLGASDDELGIPPPSSASSSGGEEEETVKNEETEINGLDDDVHVATGFDDRQIWNFEDEIPNCYEFGMGGGDGSVSDFVAVDGLFDYTDVVLYGQSDFSDVSWQQTETLPAL